MGKEINYRSEVKYIANFNKYSLQIDIHQSLKKYIYIYIFRRLFIY